MKNNKLFIKIFLIVSITIGFVLTISFNLQAQTLPSKIWDKSFGGSQIDSLTAMELTSDGGFILGGYSNSNISGEKTQNSKGSTDYWVIKTDSLGNIEWDKTFGGPAKDYLHSLQQTADGGYILGGFSNSNIGNDKTQPSQGNYDYWIIKLDSNGNKLWDRTFGGNDRDVLYTIKQTKDGGYILGGWSFSGISGDKSAPPMGNIVYNDFWILKVDSLGNKEWDKSKGGPFDDTFTCLQQTSDGGYILGGPSSSIIGGDKSANCYGIVDYWILKLDSNGNKQWDKTFGGTGWDYLTSIIQTADGSYLLGGWSTSGISADKTQASRGHHDYWVVKVDGFGNKQWDITLGGNNSDILSCMVQSADGGYLIGGYAWSDVGGDRTQPVQGYADYWVIKLDSNGNKLWDKSFGSITQDHLQSMKQTNDGGFILAGGSFLGYGADRTQSSRGLWDFWIIKIGPTCTELTAKLNATCSTSGTSVSVDITGLQTATSGNNQWTLVYKLNGFSHTVTGTSKTYLLNNNAAIGTEFKLVSIAFGTCSKILNDSLAIQVNPASPQVSPSSRCGIGSVTLSATGAPVGGSYNWYNVPIGGNPIHSSSSGIFITPSLNNNTSYYVAAVNTGKCEGPRVPVTATISNIQVSAGVKDTICLNYGSIQLSGFSPLGGARSGNGVTNSGLFTPNSTLIGNNTLTYSVISNGCTFTSAKQVFVSQNFGQPTIGYIAPDSLISSLAGKSYEWKFNGTILPVNTRKIKAGASGNYSVRVKNSNYCFSPYSIDYNFLISGTKILEDTNFNIYPNPTKGIFNIELKVYNTIQITIYNSVGQVVLDKFEEKINVNGNLSINLAHLNRGIYFVKVKTENIAVIKKLLLE